MKEKYEELFKKIVKSYHDGNFDETVKSIVENPSQDISIPELSKVISCLCGVDIDLSKNFSHNLKKAVESYNPQQKIVIKVKNCRSECGTNGEETFCQKSCPFDAIFIDNKDNKVKINPENCTDCGLCVDACPNDTLMDRVEFVPLMNLLRDKKPVFAVVAPAIAGQFGKDASLGKLRTAFKKIGFTDMIEVAFFADMLSLKESFEFNSHVKTKNDFMITSCCCPMWVAMLKRVYKNLVKHVSPSVSPMMAAGRVIKKLNPGAKVVFIGPCIAKKAEAKEKDLAGTIDFVLTFEELRDIFDALNIKVSELKGEESIEYASRGGRLYARAGGVSTAVGEDIERLFPQKFKLFKSVKASGVKECKALLEKAQNGEIDANFIEGMGCVGGCVGGPKALIPKEDGKIFVNQTADSSEVKVSIDSECMNEILSHLGIKSSDDFKDPEKISIFERDF